MIVDITVQDREGRTAGQLDEAESREMRVHAIIRSERAIIRLVQHVISPAVP